MNSDHPNYYLHPMFNAALFHVPTRMIDELVTVISQWLWCGATGGYILGESRIGKSRAATALKQTIFTRSGELVPVYCLTISKRDVKTITSIFKNTSRAVGQRPSKRDHTDDLSETLVHALAEASLQNNLRQVILVVDEMQRLTLEQISAFEEMYDELVRMYVNLLTIFIGNDTESDDLLAAITLPSNAHIRGRFFQQSYRFTGIRNIQDVEHCLNAYDSLRFPADGPTYTEYFLPDAYAANWRLKSLAKLLWDIYEQGYQKPLGLRSWGMQYFVATVNTLLIDYLPNEGVLSTEALAEMVQHCVAVSGLVPGQVHLGEP